MTRHDDMDMDLGLIVDWLDGRLDPEEARRVQDVVDSGDPREVAAVAWLSRFREATRLCAEPVPADLSARLTTLPVERQHEPQQEASRSWRDRLAGALRATITFDSVVSPGLAMARSVVDSTRQIVISGPGLDIAVDLEAIGATTDFRAALQLLPLTDEVDAADMVVQVWVETGLVASGRTDRHGHAEVEPLPSAVVLIECGDILAELDLRQRE